MGWRQKWKQHRFITIPLIKPTIIMLFIMNVGQIFRSDFGLFYQVPMNQGALYNVTQTIIHMFTERYYSVTILQCRLREVSYSRS